MDSGAWGDAGLYDPCAHGNGVYHPGPDHSGSGAPTRKYAKTMEGSGLGQKITASDDRWGIQKEAVSAVPSEDQSTVTVTFRLTVGLKDPDGTVNTNPDTYGRTGPRAV